MTSNKTYKHIRTYFGYSKEDWENLDLTVRQQAANDIMQTIYEEGYEPCNELQREYDLLFK